MQQKLFVYNTLTRTKELFEPINPPKVGMYVCGPTVYGEAHLGHARPAITFDLVFRYLKYIGYQVRYVRNITDVGHLVNDADEGEDKIAKKALLEQLEPMEIAQQYIDSYHFTMDKLNVSRPSIEPRASGHIIEQLEMVEKILHKGLAYISDGNVYFDVEKYNELNHYGKLSGRKLEDLYSQTRELDGQETKRQSFDFALWKKAAPEHIMRWKSPYGEGFPGWHLECSAMSTKYLGEQFDIHGGGMDLLFPHHECEIAQSVAANGTESVKYWLHNNMITINGQKMGKSLGNFINLTQFFAGKHTLLKQAYSPMTIRFFILQTHYRSTLDFSNEALQASEKGLQRLLNGMKTLQQLKTSDKTSFDIQALRQNCFEAMNDDFNSAILISHLFDGVRFINSIEAGTETITAQDIELLKSIFQDFAIEVLGLKDEQQSAANDQTMKQVVDLLLNIRLDAKARKDFANSDKIRDELLKIGITVKDKKDGFDWEVKS